jgi:pimeloyl-ACP methyl ester carboxylesterase
MTQYLRHVRMKRRTALAYVITVTASGLPGSAMANVLSIRNALDAGNIRQTAASAGLPPTPSSPSNATSTLMTTDPPLFAWSLGKGPPVIFLHGGLAHADYWAVVASNISKSYYVAALDTRGHGRSPMPHSDFSYSLFAHDAATVLDFLQLQDAHVIGWSDGAITALELAIRHPSRVKSLFLFGANYNSSGIIPSGSGTPLFRAYAHRCEQDYQRLAPSPGEWSNLYGRLKRLWRSEPNLSESSLSRISCPTTIYQARQDEVIALAHAKRIASLIPKATFAMGEKVTHFALLQDPSSFSNAVTQHLERARA